MTAIRKEDEPDVIWVSIPLDLKTFAWLAALAEDCHAFPETVAASIVRDIREDDEIAHMAEAESQVARLN